MRFGIHVPKQRNLPATARYAADIGCETMQIFSGNPMSWNTGALAPAERDGFIEEIERADIRPVVLHTPYLINLASPDSKLRSLSTRGLAAAMTRAHELRAGPVIVHCGNHMGDGVDAGIERAVKMLEDALDRTPANSTVAVENGAGRGTEIGLTVDELTRLVEPLPRERVGILLDTAHLWGAGFELSSGAALDGMVADLTTGPGMERVWAIHGNDSDAELGSMRDRHALWDEGNMGRKGLRNVVGCEALSHLPFIFEIPGETPGFDRKRLASMKRLDKRLNGSRRDAGRSAPGAPACS